MKIENTAKMQNLNSDESLSLEKLSSGEYKMTAKREFFGMDEPKEPEIIEMVFTKNGMNALIGSWMAVTRQIKDSKQE